MVAKFSRKHPGENAAASRLDPKVDRLLASYATAATAAAVGILALSCSAEAKIIYTHTHRQLPLNKYFPLDLNHDGIADVSFANSKGTTSAGGGWGVLTIFPTKSANRIWGDKTSNGFIRYASALVAGTKIGAKGQFTPGDKLMAHSSSNGGRRRPSSSYNCKGPWKNASNRYLGLKFMIHGKTHYGWARLTVTCSNTTVTATLTGYAYETIPNRPIIAGKTKGPGEIDSAVGQPNPAFLATPTPQPATLGVLALGSPGLAIWRREESVGSLP
jgi:hypothetical protein